MADNLDKIATDAVNRFKQELKPETLESLSASDFERLTMVIKTVIAQERENTAMKLEAMAQDLKADIKYIDIGL